jgi:hypothetical protein
MDLASFVVIAIGCDVSFYRRVLCLDFHMAWESQQIEYQDVAQKESFIYHQKRLFEEIINLVFPTWCSAWLTHKRQPIGLRLIGPKIDLHDLTYFRISFLRGF